MVRFRRIFESIAYAGIKPGGPTAPTPPPRRLGRLRELVERFLNGPSSSDPFCLSNRSLGQKVRLGILTMIPLAVVLGAVGLASAGYFDRKAPVAPPHQSSDAQTAASALPDLNKDLAIQSNRNLQLLEVVVGRGKISGTVRNTSDHVITDAEMIFDLTNAGGSVLGAVSCKIDRIAPQSSARFQIPITQADAVYALVREVRDR